MFIICIYAALHLCGVLALLRSYTAAASPGCVPPVTLSFPWKSRQTLRYRHCLSVGNTIRTRFQCCQGGPSGAGGIYRAPGRKRGKASGVRCLVASSATDVILPRSLPSVPLPIFLALSFPLFPRYIHIILTASRNLSAGRAREAPQGAGPGPRCRSAAQRPRERGQRGPARGRPALSARAGGWGLRGSHRSEFRSPERAGCSLRSLETGASPPLPTAARAQSSAPGTRCVLAGLSPPLVAPAAFSCSLDFTPVDLSPFPWIIHLCSGAIL